MALARMLKSVDFYRRVPKDLTEASVSGAGLSIMVALFIIFLFGMELHSYLAVKTSTSIMVDESRDGELMHIGFDISFPELWCELVSVDVSDELGTKRYNVTASVHKYSIVELEAGKKKERLPSSPSVGCRIKGRLEANKVPGNIVFSSRSAEPSFHTSQLNVSHTINHFTFGDTLSPDALDQMKLLTPYLGGSYDRLLGKSYIISQGPVANVSIEHHIQIVKTELHSKNKIQTEYEYTAHSNTVIGQAVPVAKFHFEPSAMQVVVTEVPKSFSHFITNLCAIIGGVFTVAGILDEIFHSAKQLVRKVELGKHM